jgi:hypothetical protein
MEKYKTQVAKLNKTTDELKDQIEKAKAKTSKYIKLLNERTRQYNLLVLQRKKDKIRIAELEKKDKIRIAELEKYKIRIAELEKKMEENEDESESEDEDEEDEEPAKSKYTTKGLQVKLKSELKDMCRSKGIGGYSKFKKDDLIAFMLAHPKMK